MTCPFAATNSPSYDFLTGTMAKFMVKMKENRDAPLDNSYAPPPKPDWYDDVLVVKGQSFIMKHLSSIVFNDVLSLYMTLAFGNTVKPLVYTRKTDKSSAACKRYYDTLIKHISWFREDLWDESGEAYKNIVSARTYHLDVSKKMNSAGLDAVEEEIEKSRSKWPKSDKKVKYVDDGINEMHPEIFDTIYKTSSFITQAEMTLSIFGFAGLVILFPEKLGIFNPTDEELEAFVHLWRVIGYMLGIKDDINLCKGSLLDVKNKCSDFVKHICVPNLRHLNDDWEYMSKVFAKGVQHYVPILKFEDSVMYYFWMLDVKCDNFKSSATWTSRALFFLKLAITQVAFRIPFIKAWANQYILDKLNPANACTMDCSSCE